MFKLLITLILIYNINFIRSLEVNLDLFIPLTPRKEYVDNFKGQVSKFNRSTYMLNVDCDLYKQIDNRFSIRMDLFARQGNEYRKIFTKIYKDVCNFVENDQLFYHDLVQHSNVPETCPAEPKHYFVKNYVLSVPSVTPAIFFTSEYWKMYAAVELDGQAVVAIEVYFNVKRF